MRVWSEFPPGVPTDQLLSPLPTLSLASQSAIQGSEGRSQGSPGGTGGKELTCQCRRLRDVGSSPGFLAWEIPWTEEPGGLQSIGLQRARHDWSDLAHRHAGRSQESVLMLKVISPLIIFRWREKKNRRILFTSNSAKGLETWEFNWFYLQKMCRGDLY